MAYEHDNFIDTAKPVWNYSFFSNDEVKQFQDGELFTAYEKFGSHQLNLLDTEGYYFAVWAPNAQMVSVIGDFNGWKHYLHKLYPRLDSSGIWEGFIPRLQANTIYKYFIKGIDGAENYKADPFAVYSQLRPLQGSITYSLEKDWEDEDWMKKRTANNALNAPWSVYEVHLGSWMVPDRNNPDGYTSYLDLIPRLVPYVKEMGFTHVEFMPVMEYPYDGSWGYQVTGFFSCNSRFGKPEELMQLIEAFHKNDIGVILDWVPSHFPGDGHGLYKFDGAHTYEYADMRKGYHPDWNSYVFNYARNEVVSFLISSAHFWCRYYHADGLRVDAVNSMMRLDFSRADGEWEPNDKGGNENFEASAFLRKLNGIIYNQFEGVQTIAEDASDWPKITTPLTEGGYGFGMKWMIGWMNDIFRYFKKPPSVRVRVQNDITFSMMYFYNEKFMLPFSHDEVVHGKSPIVYKMPGNEWEKFANTRLLYAFMFTHPGAKLLFMGDEFGQTCEWDYKSELRWELLEHWPHEKLQECVRTLNYHYRHEPALYIKQFDPEGFKWVDINHRLDGILAFMRSNGVAKDEILVVMNITNIPKTNWEIDVEGKAKWREIFNTDDKKYFGSGDYGNTKVVCKVVDRKKHLHKLTINIGPFALMMFK